MHTVYTSAVDSHSAELRRAADRYRRHPVGPRARGVRWRRIIRMRG